jgi:hypothetical protein
LELVVTLLLGRSKEAKFKLDINVVVRVLTVDVDNKESSELGKLYKLSKELNTKFNVDKNQFIVHENKAVIE